MTNIQTVTLQGNTETTKLLGVGRIWVNDEPKNAKSPVMNLQFDRQLGVELKINAGTRLVIFKNEKREGSRDADYRVAAVLPAAIADMEIARQKAYRIETTAPGVLPAGV